MKRFFVLIALTLAAIFSLRAANIVWISEAPNNGGPFWVPHDTNFADHGWIVVLTNAGHSVQRFNPQDGSGASLSAAELAALHTNDLIIIGRTVNSGDFQNPPRVTNWNTGITIPVMTINAYLARFIRMGWFQAPGNTQPDGVPTRVAAIDLNDLETDYIFGDVEMNGTNTVEVYDEAIDRNTSHVVEVPVAGGNIIARTASAIFGTTNPVMIAEWPAGTVVRNGQDVLSSYRMYFAAGSRELGGASIPGTAGKENLTPTGENLFLRAVEIAIRRGVSPISPTAPVALRRQPVSVVVNEGLPAVFSASVTGAPPRMLQWQRDDGAGFVDIPGATSSRYTLPRARATDSGARFRLNASNAYGNAASDVVTLTVNPDTTPATATLVRGTESFSQIYVRFSEAVDDGAADAANYQLDGGFSVTSVTLLNGGTNALLTVNAPLAAATGYNLTLSNIRDTAVSSNALVTVSVPFTTFCTQPGFLRRELYTGITGVNVSDLLNSAAYYNFSPSSVNLQTTNETAVNAADNFGTRMSGYLIPAVSGEHVFYLCSDDASQLWLSTDSDPRNAVLVARETTWNAARTWTGDRAGGSRSTNFINISTNVLVAGERYYFQVLHKEGTGGDNLGFTWQQPGDSIPANGTPSAISAAHLVAISPCVTVNFAQNPQSQTVFENRSVTFTATVTTSIPNLVPIYQWRKDGFDIAGATGASYTIPLAQMSDAGAYDVVVTVAGGSGTSAAATLTVDPDNDPPFIVSVGSLDGRTIGVCFNELVETNGMPPTTDPFAYTINDASDLVVTNVVARPDGRSVVLTIDSITGQLPMTGEFYVTATSVRDLKGNGEALTSSGTNTVFTVTVGNLGTPPANGSHFTCDNTNFELVGAGTDIWGTADQGYWMYQGISGDFDARVRVDSLSLPAPAGPATIAKGGLIVRQTADANSPTLHLLLNPLPPGRNIAEAGRRQTVGGTTASWGTNQTALAMPQWLRLVRSGNNFTGYRSTNGTDWILFASAAQTLPSAVQLGLGVTSHTNSATLFSTGRFSNFSVSQPVADVSIGMTDAPDPIATGGNITYSITVNNTGPSAANNVVVTDPLPVGVTFVSATASQGTCANAAGTVTCNLGALASGGSATITIVATATTAGTAANTATVTSAALDSDLANNSASVSTRIATRPSVGMLTYSSGAGFDGTFATEDGYDYVIEYKDDLSAPGPWTFLKRVVGDGSVKAIGDAPPPALPDKRFYRIRIE